MGIAILSGIMASLSDSSKTSEGELPLRLPTRFIATTRRTESAEKVRKALVGYEKPLTISDDNLKAAQEADVVLLGCKPQMRKTVLGADGMQEALSGKMLVSILAGVTVEQLEEALYSNASAQDERCRIIRAMPNTASLVRESMTVINTSEPPLKPEQSQLITWIFNQIGQVTYLPPALMDASTALCGSGPAFMALVLEAMADGAVAMGIPRADAQRMAAQTMRGTTGLVLNGEHPAILKDKVSTPGGCTIGGLLVLEEGGVRGTVSRAVREATVVASQLGQGKAGVNGTRH